MMAFNPYALPDYGNHPEVYHCPRGLTDPSVFSPFAITLNKGKIRLGYNAHPLHLEFNVHEKGGFSISRVNDVCKSELRVDAPPNWSFSIKSPPGFSISGFSTDGSSHFVLSNNSLAMIMQTKFQLWTALFDLSLGTPSAFRALFRKGPVTRGCFINMVPGDRPLENSFCLQREGRVYSTAAFVTFVPNTIWYTWLTGVLSMKLRNFRLWSTVGVGLFFPTTGTVAVKYNFRNLIFQGFIHRGRGDAGGVLWQWKGSLGYKFSDEMRLSFAKLNNCCLLLMKKKLEGNLVMKAGILGSLEQGLGVTISMNWN
jgi:hypothetical protein